jgi:tetratricopeptide (TPR) repeat protein
MDIDPDLRQFQHWDWPLAVQAIVLLALAGAAVAGLRRWPRLAFAALWFLLHLAPTNSLIPRLDLANERHLYLAAIGPLLLFGTWLAARWQLGVAVCCVLATCTYARNLDYRSEVALWHRTVATSPGNPRAHNNLGYAYELNGRLAEARFEYQHALALRPDYWRAEFNLRRVSAKLRGQPAP